MQHGKSSKSQSTVWIVADSCVDGFQGPENTKAAQCAAFS